MTTPPAREPQHGDKSHASAWPSAKVGLLEACQGRTRTVTRIDPRCPGPLVRIVSQNSLNRSSEQGWGKQARPARGPGAPLRPLKPGAFASRGSYDKFKSTKDYDGELVKARPPPDGSSHRGSPRPGFTGRIQTNLGLGTIEVPEEPRKRKRLLEIKYRIG